MKVFLGSEMLATIVPKQGSRRADTPRSRTMYRNVWVDARGECCTRHAVFCWLST
jgi:hypothetical protein